MAYTIAKWEDHIQFSFLKRIDKKNWTFLKKFIVEKMVRFNTIFKNTSVLLVEKICDLLQVTGR
jgi:hypothetical protein